MVRQRRYAASRPCRPTSLEPTDRHARSGWNLEYVEGEATEDRRMRVRIGDTEMNSRTTARIGVVVPYSNTNLESDMILLCPVEASLHFTRAGGYDLDAMPDADQMRKFALTSLETAITWLAAVRPHVILYGCTSATISLGREFDSEFSRSIERQGGAPAIT